MAELRGVGYSCMTAAGRLCTRGQLQVVGLGLSSVCLIVWLWRLLCCALVCRACVAGRLRRFVGRLRGRRRSLLDQLLLLLLHLCWLLLWLFVVVVVVVVVAVVDAVLLCTVH